MLLKTPELVEGSATAGKITNVHEHFVVVTPRVSWVNACALTPFTRACAFKNNCMVGTSMLSQYVVLMSLQVFVV